MQLRAELVHADQGVRVVQLSAWLNGACLGSTLAEAETVEQAEARAEQRLRQRLSLGPALEPETQPLRSGANRQIKAGEPALPAPLPRSQPMAQAPPAEPPPAESPPAEPPPLDPQDWSDELAQIELQLRRLGWNREQEGLYLERAFGHPSRNRITTYADLVAYGQALAGFADGADPGSVPVPLRRRDLLSQCDALLAQLGWDGRQGRSFLEQQFQLASRSQLNDEQLLQFNMLLESALIDAGPTPSEAGISSDGEP